MCHPVAAWSGARSATPVDGTAAVGAAQMAEEQREVRVWGGIHYRNSLVVSDEMGRRIAAYLVANSLKPAR
jgi:hypothetical protein